MFSRLTFKAFDGIFEICLLKTWLLNANLGYCKGHTKVANLRLTTVTAAIKEGTR